MPAVTGGDMRRWLALVVLCLGQLMIVLDATVVNVALPTIQHDLHFSQASLAWVINGYLITFGGLLLLAGRLGDLLGRKTIFLAGLGLFTVASLLCGIADSQALLIGARFFQGAGAATIASMVLGILVTLFPQVRERATAMSIYAFVASAGGSIGLLVGGVLTEALSWHWIFFINLPIGIGVGVLAMLLLPAQPGVGGRRRIDALGAVLITATPSLLVYAILQASQDGWATLRTLQLTAGALALLVAFILLEWRIADPLIPLRIFRSRTVTGANLTRAMFGVGMFGSFFLGALYLQRVLGYSAIGTGLAFLPNNLTVGLFSLVITRRIVARFGARAPLVVGLILVAGAQLVLSRAPVRGSFAVDILPAMLMFGIGAGLFFMPSVTLAMADAGPGDSGIASGLANVSLQIGAAIGVAVLASVSAGHTNAILAGGVSPVSALASGYHLGFLVAAGVLVAAAAVGLLTLRPAHGGAVVIRLRRALVSPRWLMGRRVAQESE